MVLFLFQLGLFLILARYLFWGNVRNRGLNCSSDIPFGYKGIPFVGFLPYFRSLECKQKLIEMRRYGKICKVRIGSYECIFLNDYQLIKNAWNSDYFCARPDIPGILERTRGFKGGIIFNDGKDFAEQRKFVLQLLKIHGLGKVTSEEITRKEIAHVIDKIEEGKQCPISTRHLFNIASFNILWGIITGGSRFSHSDPQMCELVEVLNRHMELNDGSSAAFFMPWLSKYLPWFIGWKNYIRDANYIFDFWMKFAKETKKLYAESWLILNKENDVSFLEAYCGRISQCTDPNSSFYKEKGESSLATVLQDLFIAGSETTASTLQWVFLYLATFPECQGKIAQEILANIGATTKPSLQDAKRLHYTNAFIYETLRYSTLAPLGMLHSTSENVSFLNYFIPKGTIVVANLFAVHFDPTYWSKPDLFDPERFLDNENHFCPVNHDGFIPFSLGKRYCPGSKLAKQTLVLALASIVQKYEVFLHPLTNTKAKLSPKIGISAIPQAHELIFASRKF